MLRTVNYLTFLNWHLVISKIFSIFASKVEKRKATERQIDNYVCVWYIPHTPCACMNINNKTSENMKAIEFRKELVQLMVSSLITNLELCASIHQESKSYCEKLMDKLESAYEADNIDELDKLFGMCRKVLMEREII